MVAMMHMPRRKRRAEHSARRLLELDALLHQTLRELRETLDRLKEVDRNARPDSRPDAG